MNILRAYDAILTKAPLKTKTATAFVIFGLCEFNAQILIVDKNKKGHDGVSDQTILERIQIVDFRQVAGYGIFCMLCMLVT
jgi:hypothetical protein